MRFIDTNVFLRYFVRDGEGKSQEALGLLRRVSRNEEEVVTSPMVIFETVFTLGRYYKVPRQEVRSLMQTVLSLRGLRLDFRDVFESALDLYAEKNISFADAFNACFMRDKGVVEIYSYDADLDAIEELTRVTP